ncbi:protein rolling stone-like isoform X2 [Mercenaria mercenaria]|nr:protein rolling stone-like isoform X2 [Mercenaria mercenaria]
MLYYAAMLGLDIYYNYELGSEYFIYLTNWSYLLQAAHVFLDFGVTVFTHNKRRDIRDSLATGTPWYIKVLWVFFNVNNVISLLVTTVYYALLEPEFNHGSINKHLLNTIYTLFNLVFCAKPVQMLHFYQPMIFGFLYLLFSIIYHLLGYAPIYEVVDWSNTGKTSLLVCVLIFVGIPLLHLVCFSIQTLRLFISWKWKCSGAKVSDNEHMKRGVTTRDVELHETAKSTKAAVTAPNTVKPDSEQA